jgi:hypothetical protein
LIGTDFCPLTGAVYFYSGAPTFVNGGCQRTDNNGRERFIERIETCCNYSRYIKAIFSPEKTFVLLRKRFSLPQLFSWES